MQSLATGSKLKSYSRSIKTAGRSLLTIINDILDLSKVEAGKLEIQSSAINPIDIMYEIEQIFKLKAQQKNINLVIDIPDTIYTIADNRSYNYY